MPGTTPCPVLSAGVHPHIQQQQQPQQQQPGRAEHSTWAPPSLQVFPYCVTAHNLGSHRPLRVACPATAHQRPVSGGIRTRHLSAANTPGPVRVVDRAGAPGALLHRRSVVHAAPPPVQKVEFARTRNAEITGKRNKQNARKAT